MSSVFNIFVLEYVDVIYTEVNVKHLYKDCPLINEMDIYLNSKGFIRIREVILPYGWGDALYVKGKLIRNKPNKLLKFIKFN